MSKNIRPNLTFYIDKSNRNRNGQAPIKANISFPIVTGSYITTLKATGEKKTKPQYLKKTKIVDHVLLSDWNTNQKRVRPPRPGKKNRHIAINSKLELLLDEFNDLVDQCEIKRIELTPEMAERFLKGERHFSNKPFWQSYEEYLKQLRIQPKTLQNYTLYKTKLKEFEEDTGFNIDYHTINTEFFERYQYYILTEKGLGWNTFATAIKKLKFFMEWSRKVKYHSELSYKEFSATEKQGTVVFLNIDELMKLYRHDFKNKQLNQVRDRFCFGCFTGLAFADLDELTHEHINKNAISKLRKKSKTPLNIPLAPQAIEIINRYQGKFKVLPKISQQKFNDYIEDCCREAGIDAPTVFKTFPKGLETENIAPKFKLIRSHTARKTFITYLYHTTKDEILTAKIAGCSPEIIKKHYVGTDKTMEKEAMKKAFGNLK